MNVINDRVPTVSQCVPDTVLRASETTVSRVPSPVGGHGRRTRCWGHRTRWVESDRVPDTVEEREGGAKSLGIHAVDPAAAPARVPPSEFQRYGFVR